MFKTRRRFEKKVMTKVVKDNGKWYCFFGQSCREGDTKDQAIENAYQLWKGNDNG